MLGNTLSILQRLTHLNLLIVGNMILGSCRKLMFVHFANLEP